MANVHPQTIEHITSEPTLVHAAPVAKTALAERGDPPGQITLRFRRWFSDGRTAYMRGQEAGFSAGEADRILNARPPAAVIVERQTVVVPGMVQK